MIDNTKEYTIKLDWADDYGFAEEEAQQTADKLAIRSIARAIGSDETEGTSYQMIQIEDGEYSVSYGWEIKQLPAADLSRINGSHQLTWSFIKKMVDLHLKGEDVRLNYFDIDTARSDGLRFKSEDPECDGVRHLKHMHGDDVYISVYEDDEEGV